MSTAADIRCDHEEDSTYRAGPPEQFPWYQAAIYWAQDNKLPDVMLESGTITVTAAATIPFEWPLHEGAAVHVPRGIRLHGAKRGEGETIFNVAARDPKHPLAALVLVSNGRSQRSSIYDAEVSWLTLVGTDEADAESGQKCDSVGLTMDSITTLASPRIPPALVPEGEGDGRRASTGVWVDESDGNGPPVSVHHVKVAHAGAGISYGRNNYVELADPQCRTVANLRLAIKPLSLVATCGKQDIRKDLSIKPFGSTGMKDKQGYCIQKLAVDEGIKRYCIPRPYEYRGGTTSNGGRAKVYNNHLCDVDVGINVAGGRVDVHHNVVVRDPKTPRGWGLSTDGHTPYSSDTAYYENYVYGFNLGFLTDGSQYIQLSAADFKRIVGYCRQADSWDTPASELTGCTQSDFHDFQDVLELQQILIDDAQAWLAPTEPFRGYIEKLSIRDNRFYESAQYGINLYRVNWAWIGFNVIRGGPEGIGVRDTLNTFLYGNQLLSTGSGIHVTGSPGLSSKWGSCYNGIGVAYDEATKTFTEYENSYSGNDCNIRIAHGHCAEAGTLGVPESGACVAKDADAKGYLR